MFDPYRKWLGISEANRPPTHYQLLAIEPRETDPDVIRAAVTQRSAYVRNFQAGQHADDATRILNEIAAAEACLANKEKRAAYDAELKRKEALSKPKPRPAAPQAPPPVPVLDPLLDQMATAMPPPLPVWAATPPREALPIGLIAAVGGGGALLAVGAVVALALLGPDDPPIAETSLPVAAGASDVGASAPASTPRQPVATSAPTEGPRGANAHSATGVPAASPSGTSSPPTSALPDRLGLMADRVVIWNTHNAESNDRGALEIAVRLLSEGQQVWSSGAVAIPWSAGRDHNATVVLPQVWFDRVHVDVTRWKDPGSGGLAEIEVFQGETNVARGLPVIASYAIDRFAPATLTDGIVSSQTLFHGYWLMPDGSPGWAEVDLSLPRPRDRPGVVAESIVLWNEHNGPANNSGTRRCRVVLLHNDQEVWRNDNIAMPWTAGASESAIVAPPPVAFDRLRVEITQRQGQSGGLAEVEVYSGGANIARGCTAVASSFPDPARRADRVTDGVSSPGASSEGYWTLNDGLDGWVEVDLLSGDPQVVAARRALAEHLCFTRGDWRHGLGWLAQWGDDESAALARSDLADPTDGAGLLALADGWWSLAERAPTDGRRELQVRAAYRYRQTVGRLDAAGQQRVARRLQETLPDLEERTYLYFLDESACSGMPAVDLRRSFMRVDGEEALYGLSVQPGANAAVQVAFPLAKRYRRFRGGVAIDDLAYDKTATPLTFRVLGDGKVLWTSEPVQRCRMPQDFDLDVADVDRLELVLDCPGPNFGALGVWLAPRLEE